MKFASYAVMASGALHVVGTVVSGFSDDGLFLLGPAALFLLLGYGVLRGVRTTGWLSFIAVVGSAAAAVGNLMSPSTVPGYVFATILAVNLVAAVLLFAGLWRGPRQTPTLSS